MERFPRTPAQSHSSAVSGQSLAFQVDLFELERKFALPCRVQEVAEQDVDLKLGCVREDTREILDHNGVLYQIGADRIHT